MTPPPDGDTAGEEGGLPTESDGGAGRAPAPDLDLAELYREAAPGVRRRLVRRGRRSDAEDLTHDAFVKTWSNRQHLDGSRGGRIAYLNTAAGSVLRDRWRRERRAAAGNVRLAGGQQGLAPSAEGIALARVEGEVLAEALGALDESQRLVLRFRIIERRTSAETARLVGKTPEAVRQIQCRALSALRIELEARGWQRSGRTTPPGTATDRQQEES